MKKNSLVITTVLYGVAVAALAHAQAPAAPPAGAPAATPAAIPTKIAVIDYSGAMARTREGQKAAIELNNKFGPRKQDFDKRQTEIEQMTDRLNKGRATMSDDAQRQLNADIQNKTKDLKRFGEDSQAEMDTDEAKMTQEINQKMQPIVANYAIQNAYAIVMDIGQQSPVLWFASATNVTDIIVAMYDQAHPAEVPAAPKQPVTQAPPKAPPIKK